MVLQGVISNVLEIQNLHIPQWKEEHLRLSSALGPADYKYQIFAHLPQNHGAYIAIYFLPNFKIEPTSVPRRGLPLRLSADSRSHGSSSNISLGRP